jgi:hypothetical protein
VAGRVSDQLLVFAVRHRPPAISNAGQIRAYFSRLFVTVYSRLSQAALFLGAELGTGLGTIWQAISPREKLAN